MPVLAVNPQTTSGFAVFSLAFSLPQRDCKPNSSISYPLIFEKLTTVSWDKGFSFFLFYAERWCGRCFLNSCIIISFFRPSSLAVMIYAFMWMQATFLCPTSPCFSLPMCVRVRMYISISFAKMELKKVFCFVQTKEGDNPKDFKETWAEFIQ